MLPNVLSSRPLAFRRLGSIGLPGLLLALGLGVAAAPAAPPAAPPAPAVLAPVPPEVAALLVEAREAFRRRDGARLALLRDRAAVGGHPLAVWPDYWELSARLERASQADLDAFYARWPGSYLEDRLRNDWLLELGRRRDRAALLAEYPRFVLDDDRKVHCHVALARLEAGLPQAGEPVRLWWAQRDADEACHALALGLREAGRLPDSAIWHKLRLSTEANRRAAAEQAASLLDVQPALQAIFDHPARYLARQTGPSGPQARELAALALIRLGARELDEAVRAMHARWTEDLPPATAGWVWASFGKQAALKLSPEAPDHFQRAQRLGLGPHGVAEDTHAWQARAALRANGGKGRWQQVLQAIQALPADQQEDPTWIYWKARGLQAIAPDSQDGALLEAEARRLLAGIASPLNYYGKLALEALGRPTVLPPTPAPLSPAERAEALARPGLQRGLGLIEIGLRNEGVREWNYSIRGLGDRELLAAAQMACDREIWDRCINTSERTRVEVDMQQRFPMPFRSEVVARAREQGLDPAYVYGLIRQESRFILDARSHVGASGLMQIMPATAKWTARQLGLKLDPQAITDRNLNLRIGTGYLKLVLDSFEGSHPMAAAGYNAGPGRPRKWREGPLLDAAVWTENIPFSETRDYVKKVLSNTTAYAALLSGQPQSLRSRLGPTIGPRLSAEKPGESELP
ncbi:lytic transglycosylase domain-containing protein [Piscinibacter sp. Jin2]|uniref:Lytic transglycosylase domain-containing protein n=1 Tax=Aquariibacter lacus TaxID=2801332 RepID=A0A9X0XBP1_9BURK|nr:lytic transglycosylase domain-containing protein [Piscinibacter lacus]MBL0718825.1 lytic transglycosylase domain-containing protein [Piscinibacter lacus]